MQNYISITDLKKKEIYSLGEEFAGRSASGEELSFTNYYMQIDGEPFFGVNGEFHFSRCDESRWEDEIIKMKMGGINVVSTYVFWIHHEEEEGVFDFSGSKNLRKFVELCKKHDLYVIVRIGPFDHGEVRNGGMPDWMYGKPFEVRKLNEGFLYYAKRWYGKISEQLTGLLYKDGGPIIAAQIDNEYMHSSAPWEITTGISNEWVFGGDEREEYMLTFRDEARKCGIITPFYTCTGWGGAITPNQMMPLWGGYAYRPWLFYAERGEHPSTEEYVYQDFHNNQAVVTSDFDPVYAPETRPYACCEMGGGMMCTYNYRFILPYKSIDAMANIKLASGCNFLGYYMFQGGTNPIGKHGTFMNESQVPKLSYDYQATLGEFGQIRESYQRLKEIHYFAKAFGKELCRMQTILPEGASQIDSKDLDTLRFALRTDGEKGFLFMNNFQDHEQTKPKRDETVVIETKKGEIAFEHMDLAPEENCILPFKLELDGIRLEKATAQLVTRIEIEDEITYVFLKPDGMKSVLYFEENTKTGSDCSEVVCDETKPAELFKISKNGKRISLLCINRDMANQMYLLRDQTLLFAEDAVLEDENGICLESSRSTNRVAAYPKGRFMAAKQMDKEEDTDDIFDWWTLQAKEEKLEPVVRQTAASRYTITMPKEMWDGAKDVLLRIRYQGDIGYAFLNGRMIHDNFYNGDVWEIGLREWKEYLEKEPLTIYVAPLRKGVNVNVESAMAARMENAKAYIAQLDSVEIRRIYEWKLSGKK